LEAWRNNQP